MDHPRGGYRHGHGGRGTPTRRPTPPTAPASTWQGQLLFEAVNSGRAPRDQLAHVIALFGKALSLRPDSPDALIGQANIARVQGAKPTRRRALRDLLARQSDLHPEGNYTLGLILLPRSPAEALGCFERGEKEAPNDADYPRSRARALIALGRSDEARAAIARAKELAPGDPRIDQVAAQIGSGARASSGHAPSGSAGMTLAIPARRGGRDPQECSCCAGSSSWAPSAR